MEATSPPCFSQSYLRNQETGTRLTQNYLAALHSTRKQPAKPWKKPPTAPSQPTHPKIYRVEPINFKELVQKLTGAPESQSVNTEHKMLVTHRAGVKAAPIGQKQSLEALDTAAKPPISDDAAKESFLALDLSPSSSRFWDAFPLLSPTNLSRW